MLFTKFKIFKFKGKKSGFTVLEMIAVIAIVVLISSSMLMQKSGGEDLRRLNMDAQKIVYNLRKAQNYAMSAKLSECSGNPVMPFGVIFNTSSPTSYVFISDCNNNKVYDPSEDIVISTVNIENSSISSISPLSYLHVFFAAPVPQTYINSPVINYSDFGSITICSRRTQDLCKDITINSMGTIGTE